MLCAALHYPFPLPPSLYVKKALERHSMDLDMENLDSHNLISTYLMLSAA